MTEITYEITATARRVADGAADRRGLHERIALSGPGDEVKELADTFDDMLERPDRAFDGQRRFVANACHELRTPPAINRAVIEATVTRPAATEDARRLGETLLGVNARRERLIGGLPTLAETENALTDRTPVDLRDIAEHVLERTPAQGREIRRVLASAPVSGDPVLLERLVQNLVDNAVRHNRPSGAVEVITGPDGREVTLTVATTGPVVAPYDVPSTFEPFRRLGRERTSSTVDRGFGLGLSIVQAIVRAHDGTVTATPRPGGGLTPSVVLPRTPG